MTEPVHRRVVGTGELRRVETPFAEFSGTATVADFPYVIEGHRRFDADHAEFIALEFRAAPKPLHE